MIAPEPTSSEPSLPDSAASSYDPADGLEVSVPEVLIGGQPSGDKGAFWSVFLPTFFTIFLAEVGDKTQMATLLLSAQSKAPVSVFLGAGLALVCTSLIGVLLGQWLASRVSEETLDTCAGILLLLITIGLVGDIVGS